MRRSPLFKLGAQAGQVTSLQPGLRFYALTAHIENPGGQWLYVPDTDRTVPPWWTGAVVPLPHASQNPRLLVQAPAGQVNTATGNPATVYWTDEVEVPIEGSPLSPALIPGRGAPAFIANQSGNTVGGNLASLSLDLGIVPVGQWQVTAFQAVFSEVALAAAPATGVIAQLQIPSGIGIQQIAGLLSTTVVSTATIGPIIPTPPITVVGDGVVHATAVYFPEGQLNWGNGTYVMQAAFSLAPAPA